jgi:endonuclease/exonuclease/phosphatase family metal-dependent hydrolase
MVLARWSAAVGPPVVRSNSDVHVSPADTLLVVSWNTALGAGDLTRALRDMRAAHPQAHVVLLLQEVYRGGPEVPGAAVEGIRFAGKLGGDVRHRREIEAIAEAEGLNLYYVPSMRNGSPLVSDEDRGNAILSTLPLSDFSAIELPFERQRRVAIAATVSGRHADGSSWNLRVVSSHLDNMVGAHRGWILGGEFARIRQARALVEYLQGEDAVVLGGDFNTWFGFNEGAAVEVARAFPDSDMGDRRPTFMGLLRLDHVFFRFPDGWSGHVHRGADRYGSDHYPLVATIDLRTAQ